MNWQKRIYQCALCALSGALLIAGAEAASFGTGVVKADGLRMRVDPSTSSNVVTMVYRGATVEVLEDAVDGWYSVRYDGKAGYMSADYLTVTPNQPQPAPAEAPVEPPAPQAEPEPLTEAEEPQAEAEPQAESEAPQAEPDPEEQADGDEAEPAGLGNGKVKLSSGTLNLRSGPSTKHSCLASIPNGTVLPLLGESDGWYQVTYIGITGYVSGDYIVKTDEALPAAPQASATGLKIVELAKQHLGKPYVYGATGPKSFDCSGLTYYVYKQAGYTISRGGSSQFYNGVAVSRSELQPGDLVFFRDPATAGSYPMSHVGIYIGNGQFIHASSSKTSPGVKISDLSASWYANIYAGARRIINN